MAAPMNNRIRAALFASTSTWVGCHAIASAGAYLTNLSHSATSTAISMPLYGSEVLSIIASNLGLAAYMMHHFEQPPSRLVAGYVMGSFLLTALAMVVNVSGLDLPIPTTVRPWVMTPAAIAIYLPLACVAAEDIHSLLHGKPSTSSVTDPERPTDSTAWENPDTKVLPSAGNDSGHSAIMVDGVDTSGDQV